MFEIFYKNCICVFIGSMAAVAFGSLIPGMVLGAAILYFSKTKKLVERQKDHEMKTIIHHEQQDEEET